MTNEIGDLVIFESHKKAEALSVNNNFADTKTAHNGLVTRLALTIDDNGFLIIKESSDSQAPDGSLYYSTDASNLAFKKDDTVYLISEAT